MTNDTDKLESMKKYVADNELRKNYSNIEFDVEADVYFFRTEDGGRFGPAAIGYRPGHNVTGDLITTGLHYYFDQDCVFPGHQAKTKIAFLSPKHYPHSLSIGKKVMIHEGSHVVGYAKITKIFNKLLEARAREYAIKHGAINLQQMIEWADSMIKSLDDPAVELFDISLAKTMSDAISGLNRLGGTGYSPEAAKRVFYFFYQSLQTKDADFERISRGLYDMALSEFAPSEELVGEMMTYWDDLDLAELGHYGDPVEIKKDMLKLLHNNMV